VYERKDRVSCYWEKSKGKSIQTQAKGWFPPKVGSGFHQTTVTSMNTSIGGGLKGKTGSVESNLEKLSKNWWVERIPPDIRQKAEERKKKDEYKRELIQYVDFADYIKIITRRDKRS